MKRNFGVMGFFVLLMAIIWIMAINQPRGWEMTHGVQADGQKKVYLTFDDGPSRSVTPKILDTLRRYGVKATFFIVGTMAEQNPYVLQRTVAEGHTLGLHSYSHNYREIYASEDALLADIDRCAKTVFDRTGVRTKLYRFPGGSFGLSTRLIGAVHGAGYVFYDWNASGRDCEMQSPTAEDISQNVIQTAGAQESVIVLLHDSPLRKTSAEALPDVIEYFLKAGYGFCTLDEADAPCVRFLIHSKPARLHILNGITLCGFRRIRCVYWEKFYRGQGLTPSASTVRGTSCSINGARLSKMHCRLPRLRTKKSSCG